MKAFYRKEWTETIRSGKFTILTILFVLFGVMNPAIAKLTPWMMEMMADSLAEAGMIVTEMRTDALTSWTQFFKNIPVALIAFILIYSSTFTKEYQSGTLVLMITKGLPRYKALLAKTALLCGMWTFCYWLCFAVTYGYNTFFWDNGIASGLFPAVACWWLFGLWTISLTVFFSVLSSSSAGVLLGAGGTVLAANLIALFPQVKEYTPALLMNAGSMLSGGAAAQTYLKAAAVTAVFCVLCIAASIPVMNKKNLF